MSLRRIALGLCGTLTLSSAVWVAAQDRPQERPAQDPTSRPNGPATRPQGGPNGPRGFNPDGFGPGGFGPGGGDGPGGFGPGGFNGGPGGPMGGPDRKLVEQFDKDKDGRLNTEERKAAREAAKAGGRGPGGPGGPGGGPRGPGGGGFGGPPGMGRNEPGKPGPKVAKADVKTYPDLHFYDTSVLRTIFLDFTADDWEAELSDFIRTDVEVPATLTVDGKSYPNVGVSFRGMSSLMGVSAGSKRSLNLSIDHADPKQRVSGYKTLNLLNNHEDPTFLHTVLYSQIAREYIPAPRANLVKVVINGESWGIYTNAQQFNKEFVDDFFPETKAAKAAAKSKDKKDDKSANAGPKNMRWKVAGSPGGGGSLAYLGDDAAAYKRLYEIKSDDNDDAWNALIALCRTLNQTPPDQLEAEIAPMLDIEGALWFLALDNVFSNGDGYWTRGSDYSLLRTKDGKFHVIPHDMNETFSSGGGPGGPGGGGPGGGRGRPGGFGGGGPGGAFQQGGPGNFRSDEGANGNPAATRPSTNPAGVADGRRPDPDFRGDGQPRGGFGGGPGGRFGGGMFGGGGGPTLDPLVGLSDASKPLRSKLLAVPALRARYLAHVRTLADQWLDWQKLGPIVQQHRTLIEKEVEADTRKLQSYESFKRALDDTAPTTQPARPGEVRTGGRDSSLKQFVTKRREYLLNHADVKAAP